MLVSQIIIISSLDNLLQYFTGKIIILSFFKLLQLQKVRPLWLNYKLLQLTDPLMLIRQYLELLTNRNIFAFDVLFLGQPPGGPLPGGPAAAPPAVLQLPGNVQGNATFIVKTWFPFKFVLIQHENVFYVFSI